VYDPAAADFSARLPRSGRAPLTVAFTDLSAGDIDTWSWDFNNDSVFDSFDQHPTYEYTTHGTYTVSLTVSGYGGVDSVEKIDYIQVATGLSPWSFSYGSTGDDRARFVQETFDLLSNPDGYIVAGETSSFGAGGSDIWLVRLDQNGTVVWEKTYGGGGDDSASCVRQTADGGYIVAGATNSFTHGIWVLKLTADGSIAWQKTYGGWLETEISSLNLTADGGYVLAGDCSDGQASTDIWVLKLSSDGTPGWQKTYGLADEDLAASVEQTTDGGYVVGATTYDTTAPPGYDLWVLKLSSDGTVVWESTYGLDQNQWAGTVLQASGGGFFLAGSTDTYSEIGGHDYYVVKLNSDGTVAWSKAYGILNDRNEHAYAAQQTSDGGYVLAGDQGSVLKLYASGLVQWERLYDAAGADVVLSVQEASDGGYALAGYSDSLGSYWWKDNFLVLKLNSLGNIPGCQIMSTSTPVQIPIAATVVNNTSAVVQTPILQNENTVITPVDTWAEILDFCASSSYQEVGAGFSASPTSGIPPLAVNFTDQSTGDVYTWSWDFDNDGTEDATEQNPVYTYNTPGTYTVSLTASGPGGPDTMTKIDYITASAPSVTVVDKIRRRLVEPGEIIRIFGSGFGGTQGDSVVHINNKTYTSGSRKIKLWSDTLIKVRIPNYKCTWFKGKAYKKPRVWVTAGGADSNIKRLKVLKPITCP
jgi:PKD repeat protein